MRHVELILRSTNTDYVGDMSLDERFSSYMLQEEARIGKVLKSVAFEIDASDTLALITGSGRIERVRCRSASNSRCSC